MSMKPAAFLEVYVDQLEGLDLSALRAANRVSGASLCVRLTVTAGHRCLGVAQTKPVNPGSSSFIAFNELLQIAIFEQHVDIRVGLVSAGDSTALHRTDSHTNDVTSAFLAAAQLPTSAMASALIDGNRRDAGTPATSRREAMTGSPAVATSGGRAQVCASPAGISQIPRKSGGGEAGNADMAVDLLLNELLDAQTLAERAEGWGGATGDGSVEGAEEGQGEFCGGAEEGEGESCGGFCCRGKHGRAGAR
ncbi:unnamed protein product [Closterium sp. Yama58-4]|nr:unnamed protein product [Closterium sp. Yama58-4]